MADDAFPTPTTEPVRDHIGDREYVLVFPEIGDAYARYTYQIKDASGNFIENEEGFLFRVDGVNHLTNAEKVGLVTLDTRLLGKAQTAFLP